jgi:hypothetical protein
MGTTRGQGGNRDTAVDFWRGFALVTIFVNHVAGNVLENFTHRNFGLSDAADLFVLLAGFAAAQAYVVRYVPGQRLDVADKVARRVVLLYVVHLATLLVGCAVVAAAIMRSGDLRFLDVIGLDALNADPLRSLVGIATLLYQPGYLNILPMYVVLLALLLVALPLAARSPAGLFAASAALYVGVNLAGVNLPAFPMDGGWFFNPLAWQFLFVIGLLVGMAAHRGIAIPYRPWLFGASLAYLAASLVFVRSGWWPDPDALPLPRFLWEPDKHNQTLPRLLHVLALVYVVIHLPIHRWAGDRPAWNPLVMMGRNALPVFCVGSVLSLWGLTLKMMGERGALFDVAFILSGLIVQLALACFLSRRDLMAAFGPVRRSSVASP